MKKQFTIIIFTLFISTIQYLGWAESEVKITSGEILLEDKAMSVSYEDALQILEDIGPVQKQHLANDRKKIEKLLIDLLGYKKKINEAIKLGLDNDIAVKRKIEIAKNSILVTALAKKALKKIKPPEKGFETLAKEYYESHPEKYKVEPKIRAAHILFRVKKDDSQEIKDQKLKLAQEVLKKIKAGYDFKKAVKEYTDEKASASTGGDLGFFGRGKMVPEFEKSVFSLAKPGDISDIVETQFGFHIIKLLDSVPVSQKPFSLVKADLIKSEENKFIKYELEKYLATFNAGKDTTIYIPVVEHFQKELKEKISVKASQSES